MINNGDLKAQMFVEILIKFGYEIPSEKDFSLIISQSNFAEQFITSITDQCNLSNFVDNSNLK